MSYATTILGARWRSAGADSETGTVSLRPDLPSSRHRFDARLLSASRYGSLGTADNGVTYTTPAAPGAYVLEISGNTYEMQGGYVPLREAAIPVTVVAGQTVNLTPANYVNPRTLLGRVIVRTNTPDEMNAAGTGTFTAAHLVPVGAPAEYRDGLPVTIQRAGDPPRPNDGFTPPLYALPGTYTLRVWRQGQLNNVHSDEQAANVTVTAGNDSIFAYTPTSLTLTATTPTAAQPEVQPAPQARPPAPIPLPPGTVIPPPVDGTGIVDRWVPPAANVPHQGDPMLRAGLLLLGAGVVIAGVAAIGYNAGRAA